MLLLEYTSNKYNFTKGSDDGQFFIVNGRRVVLFEESKDDKLLLTSGNDHLLATSRSLWDASIILAEYLRDNGLPPHDLIIELVSSPSHQTRFIDRALDSLYLLLQQVCEVRKGFSLQMEEDAQKSRGVQLLSLMSLSILKNSTGLL